MNGDSQRTNEGRTIVLGTQQVVSIGIGANFGQFRQVFIRENMSHASGLKLVLLFIRKLKDMQLVHFDLMPQKLKNKMDEMKLFTKDKTKSVEARAEVYQQLQYLNSISKLKIVGLNSAGYDLPCLMNLIIEMCNAQGIRVIKKGSSIFDLNIGFLSFRDACHYTGGMSLAKFAAVFKLPIAKSVFPYEKFGSIEQICQQIVWPCYNEFSSSLPSKWQDFTREFSEILLDKSKYKFDTFGELLSFLGADLSQFSSEQLANLFMPTLSSSQLEMLKSFLNISPVEFLLQKKEYENRLASGEYENFKDFLVFYNLLDVDLLTAAFSKFMANFERCFEVKKKHLISSLKYVFRSVYLTNCHYRVWLSRSCGNFMTNRRQKHSVFVTNTAF